MVPTTVSDSFLQRAYPKLRGCPGLALSGVSSALTTIMTLATLLLTPLMAL